MSEIDTLPISKDVFSYKLMKYVILIAAFNLNLRSRSEIVILH